MEPDTDRRTCPWCGWSVPTLSDYHGYARVCVDCFDEFNRRVRYADARNPRTTDEAYADEIASIVNAVLKVRLERGVRGLTMG